MSHHWCVMSHDASFSKNVCLQVKNRTFVWNSECSNSHDGPHGQLRLSYAIKIMNVGQGGILWLSNQGTFKSTGKLLKFNLKSNDILKSNNSSFLYQNSALKLFHFLRIWDPRYWILENLRMKLFAGLVVASHAQGIHFKLSGFQRSHDLN